MFATESWNSPFPAKDMPIDSFYFYDALLPSKPESSRGGLRSTFEGLVSKYTNRSLTFPADRHRAFQGIEARLGQIYDACFLHGHPLFDLSFASSLLWRAFPRQHDPCIPDVHTATVPRLPYSLCSYQPRSEPEEEPENHKQDHHQTTIHPGRPSWSWLSRDVRAGYQGHVKSVISPKKHPLRRKITFPQPEIAIKHRSNGSKFIPISHFHGHNSSNSPADFSTATVLKIRSLILDLDLSQWPRYKMNFPILSIQWKPTYTTTFGHEDPTLTLYMDGDVKKLDKLGQREASISPMKLVNLSHPFADPSMILLDEPVATDEEVEDHRALRVTLLVVKVGDGGIARRLGVAVALWDKFLAAGPEVKDVYLE
ncbi:hypothetical protein B0H63DRAFT_547110 [Podospora didyma]|uniref:Uncharacterized protein n=1 Tax=Podospora didyma TaxID=330526 RepID=A0AAE0KJ48_9PEZI|nr:hypothetical protein B0H63DRAFT_547110 [Podospora didyma]